MVFQYEENGMKINTAKRKTEFMHISRRKRVYDMYMDDDKLHQTESYTYLGVVFDEENHQETEINVRIEKYIKNFRIMYPLPKEKFISTEVKTMIYIILS